MRIKENASQTRGSGPEKAAESTGIKGRGTEKQESLVHLKDIISSILNDPALPFNPDDFRIWKIWEDAVGPLIAKNARPVWIREARLRVGVSDSIWLQELEFAKDSIRAKINDRMGRTAVKVIEFRLLRC